VSRSWFDGRKIRPNDPCPCGSGFKAKVCCNPLMDADMTSRRERVGTYLTLEQLWPRRHSSLDSVVAAIRSYDNLDLITLLVQVGFLLSQDYFARSGARERTVLRALFPAVWWTKIDLWLEHRKVTRVTHCLQVPIALRLALLEARESWEPRPTTGDETGIGPLLLELNGLVDRLTNRPHDLEAIIYRLCFYSHREDLGSMIGRSWLLLREGTDMVRKRYPSEYLDFAAEFEAAFTVPYEHLFTVTLAILAHYFSVHDNPHARPEQLILGAAVFEQTATPDLDRSVPLALAYLSAEPGVIAEQCARSGTGLEQISQVFPLYDHPLLRLPGGRFLPLDLWFLCAAATDGPFWRVLKHLYDTNQDSRAGALKTSLGRVFEWYVAEVLRALSSAGTELEVWCEWDDPAAADPGLAIPDAIVTEPGATFVLECTTISLPPNVAVSGDGVAIAEGLSKLWFGRTGRGRVAKVSQLERAYNAVRTGRFWPLSRKADLPAVVPVLVSLRAQPLDPVLWDWYQELMQAHGIGDDFRQQIIFMDVSELEALCVLRGRGRTWSSVLSGWTKTRATLPNGSIEDYLIETGLWPDRNDWVAQGMTQAFATVKDMALGQDWRQRFS
jgi:hypothetical protein